MVQGDPNSIHPLDTFLHVIRMLAFRPALEAAIKRNITLAIDADILEAARTMAAAPKTRREFGWNSQVTRA
jgi:hypothetical protein